MPSPPSSGLVALQRRPAGAPPREGRFRTASEMALPVRRARSCRADSLTSHRCRALRGGTFPASVEPLLDVRPLLQVHRETAEKRAGNVEVGDRERGAREPFGLAE